MDDDPTGGVAHGLQSRAVGEVHGADGPRRREQGHVTNLLGPTRAAGQGGSDVVVHLHAARVVRVGGAPPRVVGELLLKLGTVTSEARAAC